MKRLISLILAIFTLLTVMPVVGITADAPIIPETGMPFTDVKATHWFYNAVKYTYEAGIFSANNAAGDKFAPNATLTRGMFVTLLFRLSGDSGNEAYTGETIFTDVPVNQWYAKAVQWANEKGYVAGMSETTFKPNGNITRAQMARILSLYASDKDGYDLEDVRPTAFEKFGDKSKAPSWAVEGITWMATTGLISGMGTENGAPMLKPNANATRAQAAQILMGYMKYNNGEYPVGSFTLAGEEISSFVIICGETSTEPLVDGDCLEIAEFLNKQFKAALGIELPVYRDSEHPYTKGAKEILIGKTNREGVCVELDRSGINDNTYIYEMQSDHLILASSEKLTATYYAATMFLEDVLGIRYYGLDRYSYTNMKSAEIKEGTRVCKSMDFDFVSNFQHGGDDYFFGAYAEEAFVNASHNLNALGCIDPDCPYATEDTTSYSHHREHYLSDDPCLTDDRVIDRVIENVRALLERKLTSKDDYAQVWLNQDDLGHYCKCDDCALVYRLWGRSAPYVQIMTYVAEALNDEYPNVKYYSFSFRQSATAPKSADEISDEDYAEFVSKFSHHKYIPPKDITPPENCIVMVKTDDTACSSHPRYDTTCPRNKKYIERFEGWCNIFDNVCLHHFLVSDKSPYNPFPNIYELWADFDFLCNYPEARNIRVGAHFHSESADFSGMRAYLSSRLYWDKDMTFNTYSELLNDYLEAVYGDGWSYIREFIDITEELSSANHWFTYGETNNWYDIITEVQWTSNGNFEYCRELLYTALSLTSTEEQRIEAERLTLCIDYIECQLQYSKGAESFAETSTAFMDKVEALGYDKPENWHPELDPDNWEY